MLMRRVLGAGVLALAAASAALVHAQPAPDREAGEAAFRVGAQAYRANQFDVAARAFELAYERDPRPETAFSIAQANRLQYYLDRVSWRVQRAVQLYQAYLDALPAGPRAKDAIDRLGELEPLLGELRQRGELVPYVAPVRTELVIGAAVDGAEVTIDGESAALWQPIEVSAGEHEVVIDAPGYELARRKVIVPEGRFLPIDVALQAKPARLRVRSEPGAAVLVDGRRRGEPGDVIELPHGEHFVTVLRRGRQPWSRSIEVGRDEDVALEATLAPTGQRRAARWVLVTAGGLAVGAGASALWALSARRDAEDLEDQRLDLEATPETLARYNALVDDEQRRRTISTGLGVASLAVATLAAAMWWFDNPAPGDVPSLEVTPQLADDQLGVTLSGRF